MMISIATATPVQPHSGCGRSSATAPQCRHPGYSWSAASSSGPYLGVSSRTPSRRGRGRNRSSTQHGAPHEMPSKRRCSSSSSSIPWVSTTPVVLMAPTDARRVPTQIAGEDDSIYPDSRLAASMFHSWQYIHDDECKDDDAVGSERHDAIPAVVMDHGVDPWAPSPARVHCCRPPSPHFVAEERLAASCLREPSMLLLPAVSETLNDDDDDDDDDDLLDMSDDDEEGKDNCADYSSSVVSWDFWPRCSLNSRFDEEAHDDDNDAVEIRRQALLNVDKFMASLVLSEDDIDDDAGNDVHL